MDVCVCTYVYERACVIYMSFIYMHCISWMSHVTHVNVILYVYIYIYMSITCICDTPIDNELVLPECFHIYMHKYTCT